MLQVQDIDSVMYAYFCSASHIYRYSGLGHFNFYISVSYVASLYFDPIKGYFSFTSIQFPCFGASLNSYIHS